MPDSVLIVEDDLAIAVALEESLRTAGRTVAGIARTYDDVLRYIERSPIALAIVDIHLANRTDGIAAARVLQRQWGSTIIYLTGSTDDATFERAKATGPAAFLNKPLRIREVLQQVELALDNPLRIRPNPHDGPIYLPTDYGFVRVAQPDIFYLEAARSYTLLYLNNSTLNQLNPARKPDEPLVLTGNLKYWEKHLSPTLFYRLSKSMLVNLSNIQRIDEYQIQLGPHAVSLPAGTRKALLDQLMVVRTR
ncbi:response regulator [Rudanella lutea]|uniref:response regulator n=1 Tax=Rudanella lutea TaxID=451374 RepID=UPI00036523EB|nr:response regulator [Rudanella lutea]